LHRCFSFFSFGRTFLLDFKEAKEAFAWLFGFFRFGRASAPSEEPKRGKEAKTSQS
jgi:hypothetical protein